MTDHDHYLRGIQAALHYLEALIDAAESKNISVGLHAAVDMMKQFKHEQSTPPTVADEQKGDETL